MDNNNKNDLKVGMATGITIGFLGGLLINVVFIPICIAIGVGYDRLKDK